MGISLLQTRGLEAVLAVVAGLWCLIVAWKSLDYVLTARRRRNENDPAHRED